MCYIIAIIFWNIEEKKGISHNSKEQLKIISLCKSCKRMGERSMIYFKLVIEKTPIVDFSVCYRGKVSIISFNQRTSHFQNRKGG
jgi:hypothetical protein